MYNKSFSRVLPTSQVGYHAGKPIESYTLNALAVHSRPGAWNQQRLSRVATITNFNMAAEG